MHKTAILASLTIVLALTSCTPQQHRAYQYTMAGVASAGFICSTMQTSAAIHSSGPQVEDNPILGKQPSSVMLYGGLALNLGLVTGIMALPRGEDHWANPIGDGYLNPLPDIVVDGLLTVAAVTATGLAYNDNHMAPRTTCGIRD